MRHQDLTVAKHLQQITSLRDDAESYSSNATIKWPRFPTEKTTMAAGYSLASSGLCAAVLSVVPNRFRSVRVLRQM